MNVWIKFTERLPTEAEVPSGRILVHFKNGWKEDEYANWGVRSPAFAQWLEKLPDYEITDLPRPDFWMPIPPLP